MGFTLDSTGKPVYSATPTQTTADLQAAVDFAKKYAYSRSGTSLVRTGLTPGELWDGLVFFETDTASVYIYNGAWKLWHRNPRAYTPTLTNISGTPTVVARYSVASGVVRGDVQLTLTGANIGSGPMVSAPVQAATTAAANKPIIGLAQYSDVSPGGFYFGLVKLESTTNVALMNAQVTGTAIGAAVYVGAASPFTWATGDVVNINFTYEAA